MSPESTFPDDELDWLVMHHVFDWKRGFQSLGEPPFRTAHEGFERLPPVSTDLTEAWRIVTHAESLGLRLTMHLDPRHPAHAWTVTIQGPQDTVATASGETLPLALARAAVRAVEAALFTKSTRR